ncbi:MAG: class I SAM-dependent DNA methyltransferase, partial [Pirellulaceae bacterium]|nr:class I SAM-dependent DNA methyltransferase [Pirellulaceae bacterium]
MHDDELNQLKQAAKSDWSKVQPEIFGTIFQHSMEEKERHAFGAHFTSPVDIMKIIGPTIVEPWRKLIEEAKTSKRLAELRKRLEHLQVLDPACGSGNFLYIAYREMKRLEARIFERMNELSSRGDTVQRQISFVTAAQFHGIDINPFAVELAKVTMMIARKLAIDELHISEKPLPLDNLDGNFLAMDALIDAEGKQAKWPKADVIIGNPPFLDARKMTLEHGEKYVAKLEKAYPKVARRCDLCVYWFRKAHDHLPECAPNDPVAGRAGLVGTQNVRNNEAREAGLGHVASSGTIVEAVENQPWSGEANVHVSIANWVKRLPTDSRFTKRELANLENQLLIPDKRRLWFKTPAELGIKKPRKRGDLPASEVYDLSFRECEHINSSLSDKTDLADAKVLTANREPKRCFEGQQPGHKGFRIGKQEYRKLPRDERKVVLPYLNATGLLTGGLERKPEYIIDFGTRDILEAAGFPKALKIVQERVLSKWQSNAAAEQVRTGRETGEHQRRLGQWWQLKRRRGELLRTISPAKRYIVCSRVTKRPVFVFLCTTVRPDSSLTAFAFPDDYSFGILQSNTHWQWFIAK